MKYKGKGSDYYDAVGYTYGSYNQPPFLDRDPIFLSWGSCNSVIEPESFSPPSVLPTRGFEKKMLKFNFGTVGFCGKIYKHIRIQHLKEKIISQFGTKAYDINEEIYFYSAKDFLEYIELLELNYKEMSELTTDIIRTQGRSYWLTSEKFKTIVEQYYNNKDTETVKQFKKEFDSVPYWFYGYDNFSQYHSRSPMAHSQYTLMPNLKVLGFNQVVSPEQAYQELEMYLGRDNQEYSDPNSGISDKHLAAGKGFDCMSFKKRGRNSSCKTKRRS